MNVPNPQQNISEELHFKAGNRERGPAMGGGHPLRYIEYQLRHKIRETLPQLNVAEGSRVLDFGCADQPYRRDLPRGIAYFGADIPGNSAADIAINSAGCLPAEAYEFDAVLSTQVLEHVQNPALYLSECWRVLRPGGRLLLSTHGIMIYHPDPVDYWRWTGAGLQRQMELAGFSILSRKGILGLAATGVYLFQEGIRARVPKRLRGVFVRAMQWLMRLVDSAASDSERSLNALVFIIVAEKPINPN